MKNSQKRLAKVRAKSLAVIKYYRAVIVAVIVGILGVIVLGLTHAGPVAVIPGSIPHADTCEPNLPDVTPQIQGWLDGLGDDTTAQLAKNVCYHVEFPLTLAAKTNFTFDGNGSTIASYSDGCQGTRTAPHTFINCHYVSTKDQNGRTVDVQDRDHLRIRGANMVVENLSIRGGKDQRGYNPDYSFQHGISIGVNRQGSITISNVRIDQVWGDFVSLNGKVIDGVHRAPQNITIQNNDFGLDSGGKEMGSGRQGISIDDGVNVHIQNNRIYNVSRTSVDIEPVSSGAQLSEIYFDNNIFGPRVLNWFSNHPYGDANPTISGIYFRNNQIIGDTMGVDSVVPDIDKINASDASTYHRHNYQFINNTADTADAMGNCADPGRLMRFWGVDGLVIQNNTNQVTSGRCMHLLTASKVRNAVVTDNHTLGATGTAVAYADSFNICEARNFVGSPQLVADSINSDATACNTGPLTQPDTTAPQVSITSPKAGSKLGDSAVLSATATDQHGVSKVVFYIDNTALSTDTSSPYSTTINTASYKNGVHKLKATAFDRASNNTTASIDVTIKNTGDGGGPVVPPDKPVPVISQPGETVTTQGNHTVVTKNSVVRIGAGAKASPQSSNSKVTLEATPPQDSRIKIVKAIFYVDGKKVGSTTKPPFKFSIDPYKYKNGKHVLSIDTYDSVGHIITTKETISISLTNNERLWHNYHDFLIGLILLLVGGGVYRFVIRPRIKPPWLTKKFPDNDPSEPKVSIV